MTTYQVKRQEPIRLLAQNRDTYPRRFMWRGQKYDIRRVEQAWTKLKSAGAFYYYRVRCREGVFDIVQDSARGSWYMDAQIA